MMLTEHIKLELLLLAVLHSNMSLQLMVVIKLGEAEQAWMCSATMVCTPSYTAQASFSHTVTFFLAFNHYRNLCSEIFVCLCLYLILQLTPILPLTSKYIRVVMFPDPA